MFYFDVGAVGHSRMPWFGMEVGLFVCVEV